MKQIKIKKFLITSLLLGVVLSGCWSTPPNNLPMHTDGTDFSQDAGEAASKPLSWVPLPAGTFEMGSIEQADESPVHSVSVTAFSILQTEVTVGQYRVCEAEGLCDTPQNCGKHTTYEKDADLPVNCITAPQAETFCNFAGGRLPSEAEWEYAAKSAGRPERFPWGDETADCTRAVMAADPDDEDTWGCGTGSVLPVCSRPDGNSFQGLCDLAGNLWEWVADGYIENYVNTPTDGSAMPADASTGRVVRGGCFYDDQDALRTTERARSVDQGADIGFRCVR